MKSIVARIIGFGLAGAVLFSGLLILIIRLLVFLSEHEYISSDANTVSILTSIIYFIVYVLLYTVFFRIAVKEHTWSKGKKITAYFFILIILSILAPMWIDFGKAVYNGVGFIIALIVR